MTISTALMCLALNVFHEARGEPSIGQYAVAAVTLNRARQSKKDICAVVFEPHQFSWANGNVFTYRGRGSVTYYAVHPRKVPKKGAAWDRALEVARDALKTPPIMGSILYYHNLSVKPKWAKAKEKVVQIGNHIFYRSPQKLVASL